MSIGHSARRTRDRCRWLAAQSQAALRGLKCAYDSFPVAAKLWLGFGAVCGVVAALGVIVALSVKQLEDTLSHATTVAEPLSAAAYEMEINAIGSGMGVLTYLHTPNAAFVARFREDQEEFEAFHRVFDAAAPGPEARELGRRAAQTYAAFQSLGASLIESKNREIVALKRLAGAVLEFDRALEKNADRTFKGKEPAAVGLISRIRSELAGFSFWLTLQLEASTMDTPEALPRRALETRRRLAELVGHLSESLGSDRHSSLNAGFERIFRIIDDILAIQHFIGTNVRAFSELRRQLDEILDEEVQIFAQAELLETRRRASQISGELRFWLILSEALVLLLACITVFIIAKGIIEPVRALRDGTQALGSGKLGHRIPIASGDEIGQLAAAFNRMAARLQKATTTLEAEVQRRTTDLSETKLSLEQELSKRAEVEKRLLQFQEMECLGSLATSIAHDFNNLLCVILGSVRLARESLEVDSKAQTQLARALEAGDRSKTLAQKILTFIRQEPPDLEPVDFNRVLQDALGFLRSLLPPAVELVEDLEDDCGTLLGDATQLEQVIVNLGVNALQAMNEGGGSIHVAARRVSRNPGEAGEFSDLPTDEFVLLTLRDTGGGIPPEILPKVTDPFFTTKPAGQGTGLGLYMARRIIASHGGTITLTATPGQGTSVQVVLPLCGSGTLSEPVQKALGRN